MIDTGTHGKQSSLGNATIPHVSSADVIELPESEAIPRAQGGDSDAFERIYKLHSRRVYALCLRMIGNTAEAEDLTQEAFLTVFRKIRTFRGESAFSTWLHRIAANLVLMRLRKKTIVEVSHETHTEPIPYQSKLRAELGRPDLLLSGSIDRINLERAIDQLPPSHKLVVDLHDIQGFKHKEIAQIMGWSIGNSKAQLHRARRRLRELLQETLRLEWLRPARTPKAQLSEN